MEKLDKWRFFTGLIILFAGLDVTLLLSHLSRFVGLGLLLIGSLFIISSNTKWMNSIKDKLPRKFLNLFELPFYEYTQKFILLILVLLSIYLFIENITLITIVFVIFAISEILLWFYSKEELEENRLSLIIEFQIFTLLSFVFFYRFNEFLGYPNAPKIFSILFLIGAWIIEGIYLYSNISGKKRRIVKEKKESNKIEEPLSTKFINLITLNGLLKKYLPFFGILLITGILTFNIYLKGWIDLGSHDGIALLLGSSLIIYNKIPDKYSTERDFAFIFLIFLFLILVIPITFIYYFYGGLSEHTNSPAVFYLLAKPTASFVELFGITARAEINVMGVMIFLETLVPTNSYTSQIPVVIGLSCTGLYSVTTFISAFTSFVLVQFSRFNWKIGLFLALGIFLSWIANILRMTLILLAGYFYGLDALLWTHHNAGIFIFMAWIALFWGLMFKFLDIPIRK